MSAEVIHLRFHEYTPEKAASMLAAARDFAVTKIDGRPGLRHGSWYGPIGGPVRYIAYWTKTRAVTVMELRRSDTPTTREDSNG